MMDTARPDRSHSSFPCSPARTFKESGFNKTIKSIFVKFIETVPNLAVLCLELSDRLIPGAFFICMALL